MSKRAAKRRIEEQLITAIDAVMEKFASDEKNVDAKTDQLIDIFDKAMAGVNAEKKVKGRSEKKKYFKTLFADVDKEVKAIINGK